jgi:large subunit ribosomal protein L1
MGKTKTVEITGKADKNKGKKKKEEKEKTKVPGLGGGERVVAVSGEPLPEEEKEVKKKPKKLPPQLRKSGRSKKYIDAKKKVDATKTYDAKKAIELIKETSYSSFDGTIEVHITCKKVGYTAKVSLPHSTGQEKKVEFADENTIKKLKDGKIDFDVLLATKDMMPKLVAFAKLLGPRGLMPNPKSGTLVNDKKEANKFSIDALVLKTDKAVPVIHASIGKVSMDDKKIEENLDAVIDAVGKRNIVRAHIAATMSPSVKLSL